MGEGAITRCTLGPLCNGSNFVLINRCVARSVADPCNNMAFSTDGISWGKPIEMNFTKYAISSEAPGAVGIPGAIIMSHNGGTGDNSSLLGGGGDLAGNNFYLQLPPVIDNNTSLIYLDD